MAAPNNIMTVQEMQQPQTLERGVDKNNNSFAYDINSDQSIVMDLGTGEEWQPDEQFGESVVGPRVSFEDGKMECYVSDTVLRRKYQPEIKSVTRKLHIVRYYYKKGSRSRQSFKMDIVSSAAKNFQEAILGLSNMMLANPRPTFEEYKKLHCAAPPPATAAAAAAAADTTRRPSSPPPPPPPSVPISTVAAVHSTTAD
jgi:hypothetical protein